jgi:ribosomal protein S18 acetylase RimI-like enzyme
VRPAVESDVVALTALVLEVGRAQGSFPDDFDEAEWCRGYAEWTEEQVRGELPASTTSVIEVDREVVGRLRVTREEEMFELSGIQIHPRHQCRGIGTAIIGDLQAEAAEAGVPLELGVEWDNPRARALYERLGFRLAREDADEARLRWDPQVRGLDT